MSRRTLEVTTESMKRTPLVIASLVLIACGSVPKPEPASSPAPPSAPVAEVPVAEAPAHEGTGPTQTSAEALPEKKSAAQSPSPSAGDRRSILSRQTARSRSPLFRRRGITPAAQVRVKSPRDLNAALDFVKAESSVEGATKVLSQRLGKPTWTEAPKSSENAKRRIWVAAAGAKCHRLILESDGSVEVETASRSEWRLLSASARQNPCTGEITRGLVAK